MKLLIDERLHTSLLTVAHDAGHVCEHVNFLGLGLGGYKDWQLMSKVCAEEYTLVTNNRTDFTALFSHEELHAGFDHPYPERRALTPAGSFSRPRCHISPDAI